jgi:hypothetical protein
MHVGRAAKQQLQHPHTLMLLQQWQQWQQWQQTVCALRHTKPAACCLQGAGLVPAAAAGQGALPSTP